MNRRILIKSLNTIRPSLSRLLYSRSARADERGYSQLCTKILLEVSDEVHSTLSDKDYNTASPQVQRELLKKVSPTISKIISSKKNLILLSSAFHGLGGSGWCDGLHWFFKPINTTKVSHLYVSMSLHVVMNVGNSGVDKF